MRLVSAVRLLVEARRSHDAQGGPLLLRIVEDSRLQLIDAVLRDDGRWDAVVFQVMVELLPERAIGAMNILLKCRSDRQAGPGGAAQWVLDAEAFLRLIDPTPEPAHFGT